MRDFLKADLRHTFRSSAPLALLYLLCVPFFRGICNLDPVRSAECLWQSVSLAGIILIVPLLGGELDMQIRETVSAKAWGYGRTVCIRIGAAFGLTALMMGIFAAVMQSKNCDFLFWKTVLPAIGFSWLMGSVGLLAEWVGKSVAAGYMGAFGCYGIFIFILHS